MSGTSLSALVARTHMCVTVFACLCHCVPGYSVWVAFFLIFVNPTITLQGNDAINRAWL